jgi:MEMO1 family protein
MTADGRAGRRLRTGPADYARACVEELVRRRPVPQAPEHPLYSRRAACFVSLKKRGQLRGCIGTLEPSEADLGSEIARNARSAAFQDPRFEPVREDELATLACTVDILSASEPCTLDELDPARYGVIVVAGCRRGVLLPDLQGVDTAAIQIGIALQKAGIAASESFEVRRFTVTRCREGEPADALTGEEGLQGADDHTTRRG